MRLLFTTLILVLIGVPVTTFGQDDIRIGLQMDNVFFRSGSNMVHAFVYRPQGKGTFPAIIYNQATREPYYTADGLYPFEAIAKWATSRGCVLFIPDRPGHELLGKSLGEYANLLEEKTNISQTNRIFLEGFDLIGKDILAGTKWLTNQSYVDAARVGMVGHSTGAMQTLLLATKDSGVRGYVLFSPGAKIWNDNAVISKLLRKALKKVDKPILLIQAQNDFTLGPSQDLGSELKDRPAPNAVRVYPPFGANPTQAVMFGVHGSSVWGDDVMKFLEDSWKQ
ncbi:MAG: dienelactone hydrolase [Verrucomicrobiales bacterium]|nr:dienelactone hydrolase [Verrucomicrobiales bacterium]